jgi:hypothetical protein
VLSRLCRAPQCNGRATVRTGYRQRNSLEDYPEDLSALLRRASGVKMVAVIHFDID